MPDDFSPQTIQPTAPTGNANPTPEDDISPVVFVNFIARELRLVVPPKLDPFDQNHVLRKEDFLEFHNYHFTARKQWQLEFLLKHAAFLRGEIKNLTAEDAKKFETAQAAEKPAVSGIPFKYLEKGKNTFDKPFFIEYARTIGVAFDQTDEEMLATGSGVTKDTLLAKIQEKYQQSFPELL